MEPVLVATHVNLEGLLGFGVTDSGVKEADEGVTEITLGGSGHKICLDAPLVPHVRATARRSSHLFAHLRREPRSCSKGG
jgi:hypothetical protein